MKTTVIIGFGCALAASSALLGSAALAQTLDVAAWRAHEPAIADSVSPSPQLVQQDSGRGGPDRDRMPRGPRMDRGYDEDHDYGRGREPMGGPPGGGPEGRPGMMRPPMGPGMMGQGMIGQGMMGHGMMASGGARFHMRKGDAVIDVRCPADVRLNECVDAIGRMLDRLGAMGSGGPPTHH